MRLASTMKQYPRNAIPQLTRIVSTSGAVLCFRCPYQAKVMKTLEMSNSVIVSMLLPLSVDPEPRGEFFDAQADDQHLFPWIRVPACNRDRRDGQAQVGREQLNNCLVRRAVCGRLADGDLQRLAQHADHSVARRAW